MTPPLTDAQVAALATWDGEHADEMEPGPINALALEVQQSRQRRCGACCHWEAYEDGGRMGECVWLQRGDTPSSFQCADFTPKAPTTEEPAS